MSVTGAPAWAFGTPSTLGRDRPAWSGPARRPPPGLGRAPGSEKCSLGLPRDSGSGRPAICSLNDLSFLLWKGAQGRKALGVLQVSPQESDRSEDITEPQARTAGGTFCPSPGTCPQSAYPAVLEQGTYEIGLEGKIYPAQGLGLCLLSGHVSCLAFLKTWSGDPTLLHQNRGDLFQWQTLGSSSPSESASRAEDVPCTNLPGNPAMPQSLGGIGVKNPSYVFGLAQHIVEAENKTVFLWRTAMGIVCLF